MSRWFVIAFFLVAFPMAGFNTALAQTKQGEASQKESGLELIVYERVGCAWCAKWDQEIAPIYPKAAIGQQVPLRRVSLDHQKKTDPVLDDPVRFTPTFVLLRDGAEVGRITGYHNDAFFWGLLESMVERLPKKQS